MKRNRFDYPDLPFVSAVATAAGQAQLAGFWMTLVLKTGERIEGVPRAESSFEPPFGGVYANRTPEDSPDNWPLTWTITIGDRAVLAQEIAEFSVARARTVVAQP